MDERQRIDADLSALFDEIEQALVATPACRDDADLRESLRARFYAGLRGRLIESCQTFLKELTHLPATGPTAPPIAPESTLPASIPGLDLGEGGARSMRREKLYLTLLRKFLHANQDTMANLSATISQSDWPTAYRHAHSLKGVSATIGAKDTCNAAKQLESLLRDIQNMGPDVSATVQQQLDQCLRNVGTALAILLEGLRTHLPPDEAIIDGNVAVDGRQVRDLLVTIDQMLKEYDPMVVSVLGCNAALLQRILPDSFQHMRRTLEVYDFEAAARHLAQAQAQIEKFMDSKNSV